MQMQYNFIPSRDGDVQHMRISAERTPELSDIKEMSPTRITLNEMTNVAARGGNFVRS